MEQSRTYQAGQRPLNECRDHDSAQPQKYFIKSTFKHTLLKMYDHIGEPPVSHLHHEYQAWNHRLSVRSKHCLTVWLVHWPTLSALYGALGSFPGSRWLPRGLMTFALMLWLWWHFREEIILASQTQVIFLNNHLQLLYVHYVLFG